jgi:hypothetical protein
VVGAAMELRARLGTGERGEESGNEWREKLVREMGMGVRGTSAVCARAGTAEKAVVLRFGRSCAKTCRHTFESH